LLAGYMPIRSHHVPRREPQRVCPDRIHRGFGKAGREGFCLVNDAGAVQDIGTDAGGVFQDEAEISSIIYQSF